MKLLSVLKWIDAPGSIPFLCICLALGVALAFLWPRRRRVTQVWLATVALVYLILAVPVVANGIAAALPADSTCGLSSSPTIHTLVVFDGDNRRGRVREAKRLYDLNRPETVWSLGWERWMGGALRQAGIPPDVVHHDRSTVTTRDQIDWVQRLVDEHRERTGDVTIIASRLQMPRVSALLCAGDLHAAIVSSPTDVEPPTAGPWRFVPTYGALRVSRDALYEHLSMPYYRYKGWIK